jgi:hypothetical protein
MMVHDFANLCNKHAEQTLNWSVQQIMGHGNLSNLPDDLVCYYKLPYLLVGAGQNALAHRVLDYMKKTFFQAPNQLSFDNKKTTNPLMQKFWGYVLGWVGIAAQKLGRFDISYPAWDYLSEFQSQDHGGFATSGHWGTKDHNMDIITSAQLGRLALYLNRPKQAIKAGEFLDWHIHNHTNVQESLFLFVNNERVYVKDFPQEQAFIYQIKQQSPNQAYFMIGLPCAYLVELFNTTHNPLFLAAAKSYGDFALNCHESIKSFHFSHKVAWAMSLLYRYTKDDRYLSLCQSISQYLIKMQDKDGVWLKEENPIDSFDQSIENAIWLREIATNLLCES